MATLYPEILLNLKRACERYRGRSLSLDDLKALVWEAASTIVTPQERELRDFLQWAEGQLDMIQFTTDDAGVFARSLEIVGRLEAKLQEAQ
jgi:hypothetical protein